MWCCEVMTSCHDVTKPDLSISACRCARKLILFLFPWLFRSLSSEMLFIFYLCYAVTSWRHVVTSLNLIHLSQLVDELESWFFFCSHGFVGHWVKKKVFFHLYGVMTLWRLVMTSHKLFSLSQVINSLERWSCSGFHGFFWLLVPEMLIFMYLWDDIMSWRHVMTSRQY